LCSLARSLFSLAVDPLAVLVDVPHVAVAVQLSGLTGLAVRRSAGQGEVQLLSCQARLAAPLDQQLIGTAVHHGLARLRLCEQWLSLPALGGRVARWVPEPRITRFQRVQFSEVVFRQGVAWPNLRPPTAPARNTCQLTV